MIPVVISKAILIESTFVHTFRGLQVVGDGYCLQDWHQSHDTKQTI